jgi:hypothetical protein
LLLSQHLLLLLRLPLLLTLSPLLLTLPLLLLPSNWMFKQQKSHLRVALLFGASDKD